jgi:hypothetical protein
MYSSVAVLLGAVSPLGLSLEFCQHARIKTKETSCLQPRVHEVNAVLTKLIKERIHRNLP